MTAPDNTLLAERIESVQTDIKDMKQSLSTMASALNKLAVVEERQTNAAQALERAFGEIAKQHSTMSTMADRIRVLERTQESSNVETKGMNEWVKRALTAMIALAIFLLAQRMGIIK